MDSLCLLCLNKYNLGTENTMIWRNRVEAMRDPRTE